MSNTKKNVSELCNAIGAAGRATATDVQQLRMAAMADGRLDRAEVEAALAADQQISDGSQEWVWWLREITVDHLLGVGATQENLSQEGADWLLSAVQPLASIDSRARLEVLVRVVETTCSMPEPFYFAVLAALADAVTGNQIDGEPIICAEDAEQLRRVLFASAGDGRFAISRAEAEFLFDLNDRTSETGNAPEWTQMFVQAIGNHVMASFGHMRADRHTALSQSMEKAERDGFWAKVMEGLSDIVSSPADKLNDHYSATNDTFSADANEAERVTKAEAKWVFERISRNGATDAAEQALLKRLHLDNAA